MDLTVLWQWLSADLAAPSYTKEFLNSNFVTALIGSGAGAGVGAWVAQRIVARGKERDELVAEIRNTNAATVVALGICNTFLAIKKQHVKRLKETFDKQKADYLARVHKCRMGQLHPGDTAPLYCSIFNVSYYRPLTCLWIPCGIKSLKRYRSQTAAR
jgi:hypothetical protein